MGADGDDLLLPHAPPELGARPAVPMPRQAEGNHVVPVPCELRGDVLEPVGMGQGPVHKDNRRRRVGHACVACAIVGGGTGAGAGAGAPSARVSLAPLQVVDAAPVARGGRALERGCKRFLEPRRRRRAESVFEHLARYRKR